MRERFLALTFDDGPSPDTMPRILDLLARYGASATFFIWGGKINIGGTMPYNGTGLCRRRPHCHNKNRQ